IKVGYNTNPGSGNEKYFYLGDNKYKNSIGIIQDKNPDAHGTKLHGIIGGFTSPPIPVAGSNTKTVGMAYGADFIIARATDFPEIGAGKSLKSIILKDIKNGCSDKNPWNKDADVIVLGISIPKKDGTAFTESWQVYGKKNPANKDQKGKKDDKINSFDKLMKKRFKQKSSKYNASTNPVMTPVIVPVGNKVGGKAGTINGVTNSLAFSAFAVGVGAVSDEDLATLSTGDSSIPCTDTTLGTNEVLCNSACHVDAAGGSAITVMAPGAMVFTTTGIPSFGAFDFNPYGLAFAGTSSAAAHVGGAVALMKQADPLLTAVQIKSMLRSTATKTAASGNTWATEFAVPASCYGNGSGILNTHAAVLAAQAP
ncbi:MAG: S8 family serine peptidase, partial [archaeon]